MIGPRTELQRQALSLPIEERLELYGLLAESLGPEPPEARNR